MATNGPDDDSSALTSRSNWFWEIIDSAPKNREQLTQLLSEMSEDEIIFFHRLFEKAARDLTDSPYVDYMADLSEDGIQDIAEWVVSQGSDYYRNVLRNPDTTPKRATSSDPSSFSGVADNVFWERYGRSVPRD